MCSKHNILTLRLSSLNCATAIDLLHLASNHFASASMTDNPLQERLQCVVDIVFGGNSVAAAKAAKIEPSTLHRILAGGVTSPRLGTIEYVAKAFGLPVGWLVGEIDSQNSLPVPYWLILSFHRTRQLPARERLRAVGGKRNVNELSESFLFDLRPKEKTLPVRSLHDLFAAKEPSDEQIALFRRTAELETAIVEAADKLLAVRSRPGERTRRRRGS